MRSPISAGITLGVWAGLFAIACSGSITDDVVVGKGPPPPLVPPPVPVDPAKRELTNYCASNKCPTGFTTCATSNFLCDVDLRSDTKNCGACGAACPEYGQGAFFDCIEGRCTHAMRRHLSGLRRPRRDRLRSPAHQQ